jgi:hypothetical protein
VKQNDVKKKDGKQMSFVSYSAKKYADREIRKMVIMNGIQENSESAKSLKVVLEQAFKDGWDARADGSFLDEEETKEAMQQTDDEHLD